MHSRYTCIYIHYSSQTTTKVTEGRSTFISNSSAEVDSRTHLLSPVVNFRSSSRNPSHFSSLESTFNAHHPRRVFVLITELELGISICLLDRRAHPL